MQKYLISPKEQGTTLDRYVKKILNQASLSLIYKLFRKKEIKVNGHWMDRKYVLQTGDEVTIYINNEQFDDFNERREYHPSNYIESWIVYEDDDVLFVNKPRGVLVQSNGDGHSKSLDRMVVEYLIYKEEYDPRLENSFIPGPAHRIDRNTSGLVIFGKNHLTLQYLFRLLKDKQLIGKHYLALVSGIIKEDGIINAPLYKDNKTNQVKVTSKGKGGKEATTIYKVIKTFDNSTLVDVVLVTGRTHQIRVHMAYINHPIIGDSKYGNFAINNEFEKRYDFKNQFLHAHSIHFGQLDAPLNHLSKQHFEAPLPQEYEIILERLENK